MADNTKPASHDFLLVGNGSYHNRGCEAIVRGTMAILRREFGAGTRATVGVYGKQQESDAMNAAEGDSGLSWFSLKPNPRRWSARWCAMKANQRLGTCFAAQHSTLNLHLTKASVALEIGGDNYSLDYGRPEVHLATDRFLQRKGVPVVLWGASVGPFDSDPDFAPRMFDHLHRFAGVFVRESESLEYLQRNGVVENVRQVADPAFVMDPVEPPAGKVGFELPPGVVGLNLSPLIGRHFTNCHRQIWEMTSADLAPWLAFSVSLVKAVSEATQRPLLLVPHVGASEPGIDDFAFLEAVQQQVASHVASPVLCLPRGLSAAESKWIIARCAVFAGARTHSTIASLSSCVPTLSIGYSLKARGINQDIFGNLDYCVSGKDLDVPDFCKRITDMLARESAIRELLRNRIPQFKDAAFRAGPLLRQILDGATPPDAH